MARLRRWAPTGLAALFVTTGVLHLIRPALFRPLVPLGLPRRDGIVLVSGLAELLCAAGLLLGVPRAGPASAILLVAVFPGNVVFAIDAANDPTASTGRVALAWARLPLQFALIWAALQTGDGRVRDRSSGVLAQRAGQGYLSLASLTNPASV